MLFVPFGCLRIPEDNKMQPAVAVYPTPEAVFLFPLLASPRQAELVVSTSLQGEMQRNKEQDTEWERKTWQDVCV